ncbi:MAG: hypothetical protein HC853_02020 [Anaerolineae bacterium]|nr:hypothetical protein [Anaerolineae bacterium]
MNPNSTVLESLYHSLVVNVPFLKPTNTTDFAFACQPPISGFRYEFKVWQLLIEEAMCGALLLSALTFALSFCLLLGLSGREIYGFG